MSTNTATMDGMEARVMNSQTITDEGRGEGVGRSLKKAREEKNLSLDEASRATKIRKDFLLAIEEDRYEALPGDVFARGFIRSYGEFLGVDGQSVSMKAIHTVEDGRIPQPLAATGSSRTRLQWALALLGAGGTVAAVAYYLSSGLV